MARRQAAVLVRQSYGECTAAPMAWLVSLLLSLSLLAESCRPGPS